MSPLRQRPNKPLLTKELTLWRYFDLDGGLNLLRTNELQFTQLARFEDGYEGRQSPEEKRIADEAATSIGVNIPRFSKEIDLAEIFNRYHTYASCWTTISPNSMMMWSIYAPRAESVAIETTVGKLLDAFPEFGPEVIIGALEYGDRIQGVADSFNPFEAIWNKWDYYAHEKEIRLNVNANNFDESHGMRCICQEPASRRIGFKKEAFSRIYAHPKMGADLFDGISNQLKSFGCGLSLERTAILMEPPNPRL
jgi:hypothetical protein